MMHLTHWTMLLAFFACSLTACTEPEAPNSPLPQEESVVKPVGLATELVTTYWDPEETLIKEEYSVVKGASHIKQGMYKFYSQNQVLSMEHQYVDGSMEGEIREFYESGNLWISYQFTDGAPNGPFLWYHENGEVMLTGTYDNGVYTDTLKEYDELGALVSVQTEFEQFGLDMEAGEFQ